MVCNLVASYSGTPVDAYEDTESGHWLDEYFYGLTHEMYELVLPSYCIGYVDDWGQCGPAMAADE